ncbi:MAG: hypothetical protein KatS3mg095_0539 [Candidatus Parcubacteria bacterium]|nr:MAG: hypothetical protein KatS3mg095_0539 [Candidatus Parcubacteria bacterium]
MKTAVVVLRDISLKKYVKNIRNFFRVIDVVLPNKKNRTKGDLYIAIGGDGTFLKAVDLAKDKPVIGFYAGRIGFLTNFDLNNLDEILFRIKKEEITPSKRMRLEIENKLALNDVAINTQEVSLLEFEIIVNKFTPLRFRADGIIFATPTGSTAYNLSAGGPIVMPDNCLIIMTPIAAHSLVMRPMIIDPNTVIKVKVKFQGTRPLLSVDGKAVRKIKNNEVLEIKKGDEALIYSSVDFFNHIFEKLINY